MRKPLILVTGATGKTGGAAIRQLLAQGYPVRALTRRADKRSERIRQAGAEVLVGSLEDAADLRIAMAGVQRAYYCPPLEPGALRRAVLFATVALGSKLEAIVAMSRSGWPTKAIQQSHAREKWLSEKVFQWAPGLDVVTINPGFFADNYMLALEPIAHFGLMAMPLGHGLNAPPSNEDIARVIVGALVNPTPHIGKTYRPTGPKLLTPEEIAAIIGKELGRKVKYQNAPIKLFLKVAKSLQIDDFVIEELYWFLHDYQRNSFGVGAPTSAVLDVSGVAGWAALFEVTVQRYVAGSSFRNRTIGSTFTAIHNLVAGLLTPAPSPDSIARRLKLPSLNHPSLAADSASWLGSHTMGDSSAGTAALRTDRTLVK